MTRVSTPRASTGGAALLGRASLFGRRIPPTRKEAMALAHIPLPDMDRESIRKDAEGFDDVDAFFAPSLASPSVRPPAPANAAVDGGLVGADFAAGDDAFAPHTDDYGALECTYDDARLSQLSSAPSSSAVTPRPGTRQRKAPRTADSPVKDVPKKGATAKRAGGASRNAQKRSVDIAAHLRLQPAGSHGKRLRVEPLKFWMNERISRRLDEGEKGDVVVDVVRSKAPDGTEIARPRGAHRPAKRTGVLAAKRAHTLAEPSVSDVAPGFVPRVRVECKTVDYETNREVSRAVAVGPEDIDAPLIAGESFGIQTLFTEGGFVSAGVLRFPPGAAKPSRNSSRHALLFHVVRGTFEVTLHRQTFVAGAGCHVLVPRGNHYALRATWAGGDSMLFFCHCRDSSADE